MCAPFFIRALLEKYAEGYRHELVHTAFGRASRDAVVPRLDEYRERSRTECGAGASVEPEIVLGFRAARIQLRVIEPGTCEDISFGVRPGKREYQIGQPTDNSKVGAGSTTGRGNSVGALQHRVVDRIEANPEWELCDTDRQTSEPVVAGFLNVCEFGNRYGGAAAQPQRIGFLTRCCSGQHRREECRSERSTTKSIHG